MYQRRLVDTQNRQVKRTASWPLTLLNISAVVLAVQIAAWFILAIADSPYRLVVLASGAQVVIVWFVVMAWIIRELR